MAWDSSFSTSQLQQLARARRSWTNFFWHQLDSFSWLSASSLRGFSWEWSCQDICRHKLHFKYEKCEISVCILILILISLNKKNSSHFKLRMDNQILLNEELLSIYILVQLICYILNCIVLMMVFIFWIRIADYLLSRHFTHNRDEIIIIVAVPLFHRFWYEHAMIVGCWSEDEEITKFKWQIQHSSKILHSLYYTE